MNQQISVNKRIIVTMPDGTEQEMMSSEAQRHAVVYPNQNGQWCLYSVHRTTLAANISVQDYMEEVGPAADDYPAQVTSNVRTERAPALGVTPPFPHGIPLGPRR